MSEKENDTFASYPFPLMRHATRDVLRAAGKKAMIHSLVEIDVTEARRRLREIRKVEGEAISFTGFVVACGASAVDRNPGVQGYRSFRNRLVIFDDVDVSLPTERTVDGWSQVVPIIIRQANRKSIRQIHQEIRDAQAAAVEEVGVYRGMRLFLMVPGFLRRFLFGFLDRLPHLMKQRAGTIMITSVGMFGSGAAWGVPIASHTLNVAIGGVVKRLELHEGEHSEREKVCLTISFDHDIVDGGPAARYVRRLRQLMESPTILEG